MKNTVISVCRKEQYLMSKDIQKVQSQEKKEEFKPLPAPKTVYCKWNVFQKIQAIRMEIMKTVIKMSGKNQAFSYPYFKLPELQAVILPLEEKYGVETTFSSYPETNNISQIKIQVKKGVKDEFLRQAVGFAKTVNLDNPKEVVITDGLPMNADMDDSSKVGGSGLTYSQRYGYLMLYQIQNYDKSEDADSDSYTKAKNMGSVPNSQVEADRVLEIISNNKEMLKKVSEILKTKQFNYETIDNAIKLNPTVFKEIK